MTFSVLAGVLPLDKGKANDSLRGVCRLRLRKGISSCFLQSNLRASPTYALQKSSVTAKTVGVYRFLTLLQIPPYLLLIKQRTDRLLPIRSLFGCGGGICFSRASRKTVHWTIFSPFGEHAT